MFTRDLCLHKVRKAYPLSMAPKAAPPPEAPPPAEAEPEPEPEVGESKFVFPDGSKYGMRDTPPGERLRGPRPRSRMLGCLIGPLRLILPPSPELSCVCVRLRLYVQRVGG